MTVFHLLISWFKLIYFASIGCLKQVLRTYTSPLDVRILGEPVLMLIVVIGWQPGCINKPMPGCHLLNAKLVLQSVSNRDVSCYLLNQILLSVD